MRTTNYKQARTATNRISPGPAISNVPVPEVEMVPEDTCNGRTYPKCWLRGQLLNVRNNGGYYTVTLLEEEFDPERPERAMVFTDNIEAQNFISHWYSGL